jgi:hypothetical protein
MYSSGRLGHRLHEHLREQIEADRRDVAVLLGAEKAAGPPDLEVAHGDLDAATKLVVLLDRREPLDRLLRE